MIKKKYGLLLIFSVVVVIFFIITQGKRDSEDNSISIGVILPLTGNLSVLGQNEANLLRATEEVINSTRQGKRLVKLQIEDAAFDPKKAAAIANLFVSQRVPIVMVATTPLAGPVVPICEQNGQLSVVHSMTEALLNNRHLALRIYPGIKDEIEAIASWLNHSSGEISLFALRFEAEWSVKWIETFKNMVPFINIQDESYTLAGLNVRDALAKVRFSNATHILLLGYGQEYHNLIKQVREAGIDLPIIGNIGFAYAGTRVAAKKSGDQDFLAGCVFPHLTGNMESSEIKALQSIYDRDKKGSVLEEPGALYFFDTIAMIMEAVDEVGIEPENIRRYILTKLNPYVGITGQISFSDDGNSRTRLSMAQYDKAGNIIAIDK